MYNLLKNLKLREILNISLIVLLILIAFNYVLGLNTKSYVDEIMTIFYIGSMFWLRNMLYHRLIAPIERMRDISNTILKGEQGSLYYREEGNNELGDLNRDLYQISQSFQKIRVFAQNLENNENLDNLTYSDKDNEIIESLVKAQKQAQTIRQQEERRSWVSNGLANFVEILGSDSQDFSITSDILIEKLVKYIKANQGGIFVLNEENEGKEESLELIACYAYDKKKYLRKIIPTDEGLIGQAFQEKQTIYLEQIPEDYIQVKSGLGTATPNYLLLVPLKNDKQSQGVIEIAMFSPLESYHIEFIEKLAETLATTILSAKINSQTKKLLEESQKQRKILQKQEAELVESVEQLQATQEQVNHKQKIAEKQKKELENDLKNIREKYEKVSVDMYDLEKRKFWFDSLLINDLHPKIILDKEQYILAFNHFSENNFWGQIASPSKNAHIGKILNNYIKQYCIISIEKALINEENSQEFVIKNPNEENKTNYFTFYFIPIKQATEVIGVLIIIKDKTEIEEQKLEKEKLLLEIKQKEKESKEHQTELEKLKQVYKLK